MLGMYPIQTSIKINSHTLMSTAFSYFGRDLVNTLSLELTKVWYFDNFNRHHSTCMS